ncbi:catalase family peroxidase [Sphingomonas sp. BAUL-RG-20F-R05-02]|uniref:catalase family peroxidase n=1 Tax=Sphingomonas sp. BAUL-RG-20F-R05-02 TaxID=2914830 RepID=UPI001F5926C2|nr:catalase family peroxidase [Sphingomonas sp. BAUL-RG-20F-R05-02]
MPTSGQTIARLGIIAAILGAAVLVFAWVAGFLSPERISGSAVADVLQAATGKVYPGFRRAHAKGLCVSGQFEANGAGVAVSRAALFPRGSVPVIGRFSTGGGNPLATDGRNVFHALGLRFALPGGEEWRMAIDHTPIFIVSNPADFVALQQASVPDPKTGKPDPMRVKAFAAAHPETQAFLAYMKSAPLPSSFANGTYYSIDAFRFVDAAGVTRPVRWRFVPEAAFNALDKAKLDSLPTNALFDEARSRIAKGPLKWHMVVTLANPGDRTDNATVLWTGPHREVDVGTLVLDHAATEAAGDCRDYNFDPLILPRGVAASDDPLLPARSAAYSASFCRRTIEGPHPDAISQEASR